MGLRCLLGHDFGEPEVERERQEDGNEMIVTVREVKTCGRCGQEQVISENKEVTAIRTPEDVAADREASEPAISDAEPTLDDSAAATDAASEEQWDPDMDDGIILVEDDESEPEREHGQWPDSGGADDVGVADASVSDGAPPAWPTQQGEDEGFSAAAPDGEATDVQFGGIAPELPDEDPDDSTVTDDAEFIENSVVAEPAGSTSSAGSDSEAGFGGFVRSETHTVELKTTSPDVPMEFFCPECGLAREAGSSSMRAGDICPECRRGYISEREL
jgi:hypothetical protein